MSKKEKVGFGVPTGNAVYGYVVGEYFPKDMLGKLLTLVEVMGLTEKQEEAVKSEITQLIWGLFEKAIYITPERYNEIREIYFAEKKKADIAQSCIKAI
jgi:hypothetical protein